MGLFESVDTETFCSTLDATCSADCSEGTIECIESELCESSDGSAGAAQRPEAKASSTIIPAHHSSVNSFAEFWHVARPSATHT